MISMGRINQALVNDRLLGGAERVPMIILVTLSAMAVVVDYDIGLVDTLAAGTFFLWGFWALRRCATYDPRLFRNLWSKVVVFVAYWGTRPTGGRGLWFIPARPLYVRRLPKRLRGSRGGRRHE